MVMKLYYSNHDGWNYYDRPLLIASSGYGFIAESSNANLRYLSINGFLQAPHYWVQL